jgi:hypothetical protein
MRGEPRPLYFNQSGKVHKTNLHPNEGSGWLPAKEAERGLRGFAIIGNQRPAKRLSITVEVKKSSEPLSSLRI